MEASNHISTSFQSCYDLVKIWRDERQDDRDQDENNDDPFQDFHPSRCDFVGELLINAFECLKLPQDRAVPFRQMKALSRKPVKSSEILIAQQLEDIVDAFEQDRAVDLPLRNVAQVRRIGRETEPLLRSFGKTIVGLAERGVESLVEEAHLQQLDVGEFKHPQNIVRLLVHDK